MLLDSVTVSNMVKKICASAAKELPFNPADVAGLGNRNIYTYRRDIAATMSHLTTEAKVAVFQLCMNQHNRTRLIEGMITIDEVFKTKPQNDARKFIQAKTCATTQEHKVGKICTLKIDTSFPDICSLIFVAGMSENVDNIYDILVEQLWFASIHLSAEVQEVNRAAVQKQWDSWGLSAGVKKNKNDEVLKFDAEIYANAASDRILMRTGSGKLKKPIDMSKGYTTDEIKEWIKDIISLNTYIPDSVLAESTEGGDDDGEEGADPPEEGDELEEDQAGDGADGDGSGDGITTNEEATSAADVGPRTPAIWEGGQSSMLELRNRASKDVLTNIAARAKQVMAPTLQAKRKEKVWTQVTMEEIFNMVKDGKDISEMKDSKAKPVLAITMSPEAGVYTLGSILDFETFKKAKAAALNQVTSQRV